MENKVSPAKAPVEVVVRLDGLPDLVEMVAEFQRRVDLLSEFAEDVLIAVLAPESVHHFIADKYDEFDFADDALDGLSELLARYRACLEFFRSNGIHPGQVFGGDGRGIGS